MMNILLDKLDFNESWAIETFKKIIKPNHKICVIPLAFKDEWIRTGEEWEKAYNKLNGEFYKSTVSTFYTFGIKDKNIELLNYFEDTFEIAQEKINSSDIILFTGGYPDKIISRLGEMNLIKVIEKYEGIIMGWSAGAMIQCFDYYISPDEDYPEYIQKRGLNYINNFAVEVHYKKNKIQDDSIKRYIETTGNSVITTMRQSAIIVENGSIKLLGNAEIYSY